MTFWRTGVDIICDGNTGLPVSGSLEPRCAKELSNSGLALKFLAGRLSDAVFSEYNDNIIDFSFESSVCELPTDVTLLLPGDKGVPSVSPASENAVGKKLVGVEFVSEVTCSRNLSQRYSI